MEISVSAKGDESDQDGLPDLVLRDDTDFEAHGSNESGNGNDGQFELVEIDSVYSAEWHEAGAQNTNIWELFSALIIAYIVFSGDSRSFCCQGLLLIICLATDKALVNNGREETPKDESYDGFEAVKKNIALDRLPELASTLRLQWDTSVAQKHGSEQDVKPIACVVNHEPLNGSFNILWRIEFADGVRWVIKVAAIGTKEKFDQLAAKGLRSEVQTMRLLKRDTTIPVPEVYAYDTTFDNIINSPYILMEYIDGIRLQDVWWDKSVSKAEREERRTRSLKDIAFAMVQLGQFQSRQGGSVVFDEEEGNLVGAGPMRVVDEAEFLLFNEPDAYGKVYERGPYSDPIEMVTRYIDLYDKPAFKEHYRATSKMATLLLNWIPQDSDLKFVLKHPDFGIQNFLVAEDGSLVGMIDWDGVCFQPRFVGNESYPLWLMDDWIPGRWENNDEDGEDSDDDEEGIPEELTKYRAMYAGFVAESKVQSANLPSPNMTRLTLVSTALALLVSTPYYCGDREILPKIGGEISAALPDDPRKFRSEFEEIVDDGTDEEYALELLREIGEGIDRGTLTEDQMGWLRDSFAALCSSLMEQGT